MKKKANKKTRTETEMKFKVGDRVRVREWDDMKKEFGLDRDGDIKCGYGVICFVRGMREYCGNIYIIAEENRNYYTLKGCENYAFTDDMLLPAVKFKVGDKVIGNSKANGAYTITREGWIGEVVCVFGFNGRHIDVEGKSPDGTITTFTVEAELFDLYEGDKPSEKPSDSSHKYSVGDRVLVDGEGLGTIINLCVDGDYGVEFDKKPSLGHDCEVFPIIAGRRGKNGRCRWVSEGDIVKVGGETKKIVITFDGENTTARLYEGKTLVKSETARCSPADEFDFGIGAKIAFEMRIGSTAKKEEKYFSGKVVCVGSGECSAYTVGKIYEFKNGKFVNDNGYQTPRTPIKTLEEWNKGKTANLAKFIPLVE